MCACLCALYLPFLFPSFLSLCLFGPLCSPSLTVTQAPLVLPLVPKDVRIAGLLAMKVAIIPVCVVCHYFPLPLNIAAVDYHQQWLAVAVVVAVAAVDLSTADADAAAVLATLDWCF